MKKIILSFTAILLICSLISCNTQIKENDTTDNQTTDDPNIEKIVETDMTDDQTADAPNIEVIEEIDITGDQTADDPNIGGSIPDTEFRDSFILLSDTLSHIIDVDKLPEWENAIQEVVDSGIEDPYLYDNIYEFIRFFEIPREEFEELYYSTNLYYMYDYDFDLLYSDDVDKVYEYYKKENDDFTKRNTEFSIKQDIKNYVGFEEFNNWLQAEKTIKFNDYYDVSWSIAEAIYEFDIPRESIEEILNGYMSDENGVIITEVYADGSEIPISGNTLMYEYDLDMVYDDNSEIAELLISEPQSTASELQVSDTELQGYEVDEMIRK